MGALAEKQELVASVAEDLKAASAVYLINFQGITVEADNAFRKELTNKGVKYRAVKNTLLKRAFAEVGITGLDEYLEGCSAIMLGDDEDPMLPAKEIVAFHKENEDLLPVKGINLDGDSMPGDKVVELSKMPGRKELIAQVVTIALGPGSQLVSILKGPGSTIAGQLKALEEKAE